MKQMTQDNFQALLEQSAIKPRIKREVRFATSVTSMDDDTWKITELLPVFDRAGNKGVLLMDAGNENVYVVSFELSRGLTSSTGRAQAIICDFCRTWQTGSRSGSITLHKPGRESGSIAFLCCADLLCSLHVRNLTAASKTSRSQLREDLDNDQRVERLKRRIYEVARLLELPARAVEQ